MLEDPPLLGDLHEGPSCAQPETADVSHSDVVQPPGEHSLTDGFEQLV